MIISGGENVYPAEVEDCLYQHPDVAEVAVIGVPDSRWGEAVLAVVVRRPGTTVEERDILDFTQGRLARYKQPRRVVFADALPRNPAGKVLKFELRQRFAGAPPEPLVRQVQEAQVAGEAPAR
jgi:fatty-acyl-CoA synthase